MSADRALVEQCQAALILNGFDVYLAKDPAQARQIFFDEILSNIQADLASWGGSMTLEATGVLAELLANPAIKMIKPFEPGVPREEIIERRRQALLTDLFLTGSNAITACGKLVNLDMIGNRTGGISFGPKKVVLFVGQNKIVPDLASAFDRVRNHAAPLNAKQHNFPTPCAKTGRCHDCSSPKRICNTWSIIDKCFPVGRIKVVLIEGELGL